MRLLLLLLIFLARPALADMYPDGSNAKLPEARANLGLGSSVSITDYGADPTGVGSSDVAFTSCITSGKDCRIPAGEYLLACKPDDIMYLATAGAAIFGDGAAVSKLKLPPGCTTSWTILHASAHRDYTLDVNGATAAPAVNTVAVAMRSGVAPRVERVRVVNATRMFLVGLVTGGVDTPDPVVSGNYLQMTAPSTSANQCVLFSTSGGGVIRGGSIDNNVCVNTGLLVQAVGLQVTDNDISGWNYGAGITTEATANSARYLIARNRLHDSGAALDVNSTAAMGIESWGPDSIISDNHCWNLGGGCIDSGGQRSLVANNWARGINKYNPATPGAAFNARVSGTYRADYSHYVGNWAGDDGSSLPMYGYGEQAGALTGITVIGNNFDAAVSGRINPTNLSALTAIDAASSVGVGAATVASLPACTVVTKHATKRVSDQSGTPTYRGALTGGGAIAVLAYCNGTSWEAH